jgi:hypothetical protein
MRERSSWPFSICRQYPGRLLLCAVLAGISSQGSAAAGSTPLEECEPPLGRLITILESKQQLSGTQHLYRGGHPGSEYSKCRIRIRGKRRTRYAVYRSSDNYTVLVEKSTSEGKERPVLYGPFESAYRK